MIEDFYRLSIEESIQKCKTSLENGLDSAQSAKLLEENGANEFEKKKHTSFAVKFVNQFKGFMILVLIVAAIISGVMGYLGGEGFFDAIIIMIIVVINAIIGVFQEAKAEKSLDALEKLSAPNCKVVRDGKVHVIPSRELVIGDIVALETGDSVPADLRLVEAVNLKIQEAALTGESVPVDKQTDVIDGEVPIGDRANMAYSSCNVTYGHGKGIVVATGIKSEVGKIAMMIQSVPQIKTPMQIKLNKLGKMLALIALVICGLIFVVGVLYGNDLLSMFMTAVSLAAAAIPEGLPAVSTIVLAMGVQRLAQRNAIVRNLPSVETLGSTTVICSDKTGTLTQNRMIVTKIYSNGKIQDANADSPSIDKLAQIAVLANDSIVSFVSGKVEDVANKSIGSLVGEKVEDVANKSIGSFVGEKVEDVANKSIGSFVSGKVEDVANKSIGSLVGEKVEDVANKSIGSFVGGKVEVLGDPTETALVDFAFLRNVDKVLLEKSFPRVEEIPFDSKRKLMTTIHLNSAGDDYIVATKGGLDELLICCNRIEEDGQIRLMTEADRKKIYKNNVSMAESALRVLAMAYKIIRIIPSEITPRTIENDLIFCGSTGMIDPPREEVRDAVQECLQAGIRPVMITGDHLITASAIGRSLNIFKDGDTALTGSDVEKMSVEQLIEAARTTSIFARVAPEHKVLIIEAYRKLGNIVAMTGDGVNDAPALKLADIGIAMGITGTDVSKEASDVVLADDNFATIVSAVSEGRRIYDNLLKCIQFMLSTNLGEILVLFIAVMANLPTPLLPIHILWINLVTDSLPALALSFDPAEKDIMKRRPTDAKQGILNRSFSIRIILQGILIGSASLTAYYIGLRSSLDSAHTMAFATLAFSQITLIFSIRSGMHKAVDHLFTNKFLWGAILFVVALMSIVLFIPTIQNIFHIVPLSGIQWLWIIGLSFSAVIISEIAKYVVQKLRKKRTT